MQHICMNYNVRFLARIGWDSYSFFVFHHERYPDFPQEGKPKRKGSSIHKLLDLIAHFIHKVRSKPEIV